MEEKINVILAEWSGYPLKRKKKILHTVTCGLAEILDSFAHFSPGVDFDLHIVITGESVTPVSTLRRVAEKIGISKQSTKAKYGRLQEQYSFITQTHFRDNVGYDIGSYNHGLAILRTNGYDGDVLLMNSSVVPPTRDGWLLEYRKLFHQREDVGLCGISMNSHNTVKSPPVFMPHVQSFFLYSTMAILNQVYGKMLPGSLVSNDKIAVIEQGEIAISQKMLSAGYGIRCSQFPDFTYKKGEAWTIPEGDLRYDARFKQFANKV